MPFQRAAEQLSEKASNERCYIGKDGEKPIYPFGNNIPSFAVTVHSLPFSLFDYCFGSAEKACIVRHFLSISPLSERSSLVKNHSQTQSCYGTGRQTLKRCAPEAAGKKKGMIKHFSPYIL
jgi:hypothetical protein